MLTRPKLTVYLLCAVLLAIGPMGLAKAQIAPTTESTWDRLGEKNILAWTPAEQRVGYPNIRYINPVREVPASPTPWPLPRAPWTETESWMDSIRDLHLAGLLVIQNGTIRFEAYDQGHDANQRWMSFSIAKSVVSMLYGVALHEGHIESLSERVADYLPEFNDTDYGEVTLQDLLQMSSGIAWNEDYQDPQSDVARLDDASESEIIAHLASLPAIHPPGEVFNYNTGETILAGLILARAVGVSLTEYLSSHVWNKFGMEHEADWALMGPTGTEMGGCCISATLRDYGRIGLLALRSLQGQLESFPMSKDWMREATTPASTAPYYGYFWWLNNEGDFRASGIFGQAIYISPSLDLVIAMHGLWPNASDEVLSEQRDALIDTIKRAAIQSASN